VIRSRLLGGSLLSALFLISALAAQTAAPPKPVPARLPCGTGGSQATSYRVSLRDRSQHIVHVEVAFDDTRGREFQLPVWNSLYQVRDFAQYVRKIDAHTADGNLAVDKFDKTTWRVAPSGGCAVLRYEIFADQAGPFGAQLSDDHAFFNWAQILMYPTDALREPYSVMITDVPQAWKIRDGGLLVPRENSAPSFVARADNYDRLADSPVELGTFAESTFEVAGAKYNVVVHAEPADYNMQTITSTLQKIVTTTTEWMNDRPFNSYTFIYHFPNGPAGGGMEHGNSTAIDVAAQRLTDNPLSFASVSAHEFFHAWNVKRIRPQSLEPIDYTRENYTRALWFSEGVTSTVSEHMLFRAGILDEKQFLDRLAAQIGELNDRPARLTQSVEESSLDTWFDKYSYYRQPERSINYYNKGQIIGELLDLEMRAASNGRRTLRDLFQYMNREYARKGQFFADSDGVQLAAENLTGQSLDDFFERYVAGVEELPYNYVFSYVGLRPVARTVEAASPGFSMPRNFGQPAPIISVDPDSDAKKAGVAVGDTVTAINGVPSSEGVVRTLEAMKPGETVRLKLRSRAGVEREVRIKLGFRKHVEYTFVDVDDITSEQRLHRAAWLKLESEQPGGAL
jgi:predicted metalloprotease with PDZ domain